MPFPRRFTPEQVREAFKRHGSISATARALRTERNTVRKYLDEIESDQMETAPCQRMAPVMPPPEKPRVRVCSGRMKVMVIGDAHDSPSIPDKARFKWMARWAAEERPAHVVQIGDFLTLDSLNGHIPNSTADGRLKGTFLSDISSGVDALGAFNVELPADYTPKKHVTLGNHERRLWLFEQNAPETLGMMQFELCRLLERFGWSWSSYGEIYFLGGVGFVHAAINRLGKTYGGKNAEMTIANDAVFDLVIGHSHTDRTWKAPKIGPSQYVQVINAGCALPQGHVEEYARHNTTGWSWGARMLEIEGGHVVDHRFLSMSSLERMFG